MLLVGKSIGHVVKQGGDDPLAVQEFDVVNDHRQMIPQNTFPAGDVDMPAGQDARVLLDI